MEISKFLQIRGTTFTCSDYKQPTMPWGRASGTFHSKMKLYKYMNTNIFTHEFVHMSTDIHSRICTNPLNANYIIYCTKLLMQSILGYETRNLGLWT